MCDAWLEHIYACRIRFSRRGAEQLLKDFAGVADWLLGCPILNDEARKQMSKNEILRYDHCFTCLGINISIFMVQMCKFYSKILEINIIYNLLKLER